MSTAAGEIAAAIKNGKPLYIVEHLDPEIEAWQLLEYNTIAVECAQTDSQLYVTGVPQTLYDNLPKDIMFKVTRQGIEEMVAQKYIPREKVCLLDPKGDQELSPQDGEQFGLYLFGGILGDEPPRGRTLSLFLML